MSHRQSRAGASSQTSSRRNTRIANDSDDQEGTSLEEQIQELFAPIPKAQLHETFRKQPLGKESLGKLLPLIKEWDNIAKKLRASLDVIGNAAADLQEAISADNEDDDDEAALEELKLADRDFRFLIDKLYEANLRRETLDTIRNRIQLSERIPDAIERYEASVEEGLAAYNAKTSRQKYVNNERYIAFRTQVWEASGKEGGLPNMKRFVDREENDPESEDEEIEIEVVQNFKDPITMTWLEKPVKTKACRHTFSKAAITAYIKQSEGKKYAPCPVSGCSKIIRLEDLEDDVQLGRRVQQARRREEVRIENTQGAYQAVEEDEEDEEQQLGHGSPEKTPYPEEDRHAEEEED